MSRRRDPLAAVGAAAVLMWQALGAVGRGPGFWREALRQATVIATGPTLVAILVALAGGGSCGVSTTAITRQFGTSDAIGGLLSWCTVRDLTPFLFGYAVAATVGCRLIEELAEERSPAAAAPLLAAALASLPLAFLLSLAATDVTAFLTVIVRFGEVPAGTAIGLFNAFQDVTDVALSMLKCLLMGVAVLAAALLYGADAEARAGMATARFLAVSVVVVTLIGALGTFVFWGANPRVPIG